MPIAQLRDILLPGSAVSSFIENCELLPQEPEQYMMIGPVLIVGPWYIELSSYGFCIPKLYNNTCLIDYMQLELFQMPPLHVAIEKVCSIH